MTLRDARDADLCTAAFSVTERHTQGFGLKNALSYIGKTA